MAHECFEDHNIAEFLNQHFISIKVDREERPDIDSVYMKVCQAFTGSGGWPTSIFMTPEQFPFFAGTYFPPRSQHGMIGFYDLIVQITEKWEHSREELLHSAKSFAEHLKVEEAQCKTVTPSVIEQAVTLFSKTFDEEFGGFGLAPKFPSPHNLLFLMYYSKLHHDKKALDMVKTTLNQMRRGGLFDQIGFGFSRYSTDRLFLVPHFEKMLYDNALLILAYSAAYALTNDPLYLDTAQKTAFYLIREMKSPEGAFFSAQDADSSGIEGKYYLFRYDEITNLLGERTGKAFNRYYSITPQGNFEGENIPNLLNTPKMEHQFDSYLPLLYEYRRNRMDLYLDDKILTSWNALTICAFSLLYRVSRDPHYLSAAKNTESFIQSNLWEHHTLFSGYRKGIRLGPGFLDDYAFYAAALISLYKATLEKKYLDLAERICLTAKERFYDKENGGYFLSGSDQERLIFTPKETYDGAIPSGNSAMAYNLVQLSQITEKEIWKKEAEHQLSFLAGAAKEYPAGNSVYLIALLLYLTPPDKITAVLSDPQTFQSLLLQMPLLAHVTILQKPTKEYTLLGDQTTFYVCKGHTCLPPSHTL